MGRYCRLSLVGVRCIAALWRGKGLLRQRSDRRNEKISLPRLRQPLLLQNQSALFLEFGLVNFALGEPLLQNLQGA
jgi:hypothetical protein